MPYKSSKQQKFFEMCRNNPGESGKVCPPKSVLDEFHKATYHPHKRRDVRLSKPKSVTYH